MLRATVRSGLGDLPGAVDVLAGVTGFYIGIAMLGTPAGMVKHPEVDRAAHPGGGSPTSLV